MYIDLGAEELVAADKAGRKIAVEIKSFSGPSVMRDLEQAIGQFTVYKTVLARREPERALYVAVSHDVYTEAFEDELGMMLREDHQLHLIVFDVETEKIVQWIP